MKRAFSSLLFLVLCGPCWASAYSDFNAGITAFNHGDRPDAIRLFSAALAAPDLPAHLRPIAYYDRGSAYAGTDQIDLALADLTSCLAQWPGYVAALDLRGYIHARRKEYDLAEADLKAAIAARPDWPIARAQLFATELAEKKLDDALKTADDLVKAFPEDADGYQMRARAYQRLGKADLALADYDTALGKNPKDTAALIGRGGIRREAGKLRDTIADYQSAIALEPDNAGLRMQTGVLQWDVGDFRDAQDTLKLAVRASSPSPYAFLWLYIAMAKNTPAAQIALFDGAEKIDRQAWPGPLLAFYSGAKTSDAVMKDAASGDADAQKGQLCEADFYIGEWRIAHGDTAGGKPLLDEASRRCPDSFIEKPAAAAELERTP